MRTYVRSQIPVIKYVHKIIRNVYTRLYRRTHPYIYPSKYSCTHIRFLLVFFSHFWLVYTLRKETIVCNSVVVIYLIKHHHHVLSQGCPQ